MLVAEGVSMIPLKIGGFTLHPTLIWDDSTAILIDTGMPGQSEQIKEVISKIGVPMERIHSVILTHQDMDHIGALPALVHELGTGFTVYAHEFDKPYIEGERPLLKLELPEELQHLVDNPPKIKIDHILNEGDELPCFGGIRVIFTPGHTPGHISLYLKQSKILIAGDALHSVNGELKAPTSQTTPDLPLALKSLSEFLDYDIDKVICFHGGLCTNRVNEQIRALIP
ncbi:MBL fold metallo-hydrolase [Paenibacillus sp. BR2-3]|uniref:MBL fold metallo-hydrolase n=1 Tax=Paenibacillus sp. BR2-3 TaxID=3048494 RepID=UPI0039773812